MMSDRDGEVRIVVGRPKYTININIEGAIDTTDERTPYVCMASCYMDDHQGETILSGAGVRFAAYRFRFRVIPDSSGDRDNESQLAQMLVDLVPTETWDACVAALDTETSGGFALCVEILTRWMKEGMTEAAIGSTMNSCDSDKP